MPGGDGPPLPLLGSLCYEAGFSAAGGVGIRVA